MEDDRQRIKSGAVYLAKAMDCDPGTPSSSDTKVLVHSGDFVKSKPRTAKKAWWEFYMLQLWHDVLAHYAKKTQVDIRGPLPFMIFFGDPAPPANQPDRKDIIETTLGMEFAAGGFNASKLEHLARNAVAVNHGKEHPGAAFQQLYPALAFYCGALSKIKENECLAHGDYQPRHLIINPDKPCVYIFDLENSKTANPDVVAREDEQMMARLKKHIGKKYSAETIDSAFETGRASIPDDKILPGIVALLEQDQGLTFNFKYRVVERRGVKGGV